MNDDDFAALLEQSLEDSGSKQSGSTAPNQPPTKRQKAEIPLPISTMAPVSNPSDSFATTIPTSFHPSPVAQYPFQTVAKPKPQSTQAPIDLTAEDAAFSAHSFTAPAPLPTPAVVPQRKMKKQVPVQAVAQAQTAHPGVSYQYNGMAPLPVYQANASAPMNTISPYNNSYFPDYFMASPVPTPVAATSIPVPAKRRVVAAPTNGHVMAGNGLSGMPTALTPMGTPGVASAMPMGVAAGRDFVDLTNPQRTDVIDLASTPDSDEVTFGTLSGKIIAIDVSAGRANGGDPVTFSGEPDNDIDPNAVRVNNAIGEQIGYMDESTAAAMAPLMAQGIVKLEGTVPAGARIELGVDGEESLAVRIYLAGKREHQKMVESFLKAQSGISWVMAQPQHQQVTPFYPLPGTMPTWPMSVSHTGVHSMIQAPQYQYNHAQYDPRAADLVSDRDIEGELDKLFDRSVDFSKMEEKQPHSAILTPLYPFQKQGLMWLYDREKKRSVLQDTDNYFNWQRKTNEDGSVYYWDNQKKTTIPKPPEMARGGILADEMGLGKTLLMISLIALTCNNAVNAPDTKPSLSHSDSVPDDIDREEDDPLEPEDEEVEKPDRPTRVPPTLIVCPLSVLSNWETQIQAHVRSKFLTLHCYHGKDREQDAKKLASFDIVLTTYGTLSSELRAENSNSAAEPEADFDSRADDDVFSQSIEDALSDAKPKKKKRKSKNRSSALFDVHWHRVILDEAHVIRDIKTKQCKATCALRAERRWALTGTPFQNKIGDVFALFHFLQVAPFNDYEWWNKYIVKPLKSKSSSTVGMDRLQTVLGYICLRRKKTDRVNGQLLLDLPPKTSRVREVELGDDERRLYNMLELSGKKEIRKFVSKKEEGQAKNYAYILEMLLRMRQACDHYKLVPEEYYKRGFIQEVIDKTKSLVDHLAMAQDETCGYCQIKLQDSEDPCVTTCLHFFCLTCIEAVIKNTHSCPIPGCGRPLSSSDLLSEQNAAKLRNEQKHEEVSIGKLSSKESMSAKLSGLLDELKQSYLKDNHFKAIVFSQWTSMLDIIQESFRHNKIKFTRLDGSMTAQVRKKAISTFDNDDQVKVFLISLKAGGVGLNLTKANKVYLMDPWWNPAAEDQATDRVHRMGQKKPVEIVRVIAKGTVEERIVQMQQEKRELMTQALAKRSKSRKEQQEDRLKDLLYLFK